MAHTVLSMLLSTAALSSGAFPAGAEEVSPPHPLPALEEWPDLMTLNGTARVSSPADWEKRREEILELYQHYVYGRLPGDGISVSSAVGDTAWDNTVKMTVTVARGEKTASFSALVTLPRGQAPETGFPCYIEYGFLWGGAAPSPSPNCVAAAERGYAGVTYIPTDVAGDNGLHLGAFYALYPYELTNAEFPGVLAVWGWGVSRIVDALEGDAGRRMNIDASCCIVAGVSRYGKSALVAGAYDPRIRVTVPSCSGAGGAAVFRGDNHGKKYDLSSLGGPESWENESINEPLANLQGGEGYWFCRKFPDHPLGELHPGGAVHALRPVRGRKPAPDRGDRRHVRGLEQHRRPVPGLACLPAGVGIVGQKGKYGHDRPPGRPRDPAVGPGGHPGPLRRPPFRRRSGRHLFRA